MASLMGNSAHPMRAIFLAGALTILAAGCTAGGSPTETAPPASPPSAEASAAPSAEVASASPVVSAPAPEPPVTAIIPTGNGPIGLAVGVESIFVELHREDRVAIIDPGTNEQVEVLDVRVHCALAVAGGSVWATWPRPGVVTRFDPASGEVLDSWELPDACGMAADGDHVWVTTPGTGELHELAAGEAEPLRSIEVEPGIFGIAPAPDAIWISGEAGGGTIYRADRATGEVTTVGQFASADDVRYLFDAIWVTARPGSQLWKLDPASGSTIGELQIEAVSGMTAGPDSLWATIYPGQLVEIDPDSVEILSEHELGLPFLGPPVIGHGSLWASALEHNDVLRVDIGL